MTSDAKIGLLLGLVFIFVIAFIINGVPTLSPQAGRAEASTNMVSLDQGIGIADRAQVQPEQDVAELENLEPTQAQTPEPVVEQSTPAAENPVQEIAVANDEDIRFQSPLPRIENLWDRLTAGFQAQGERTSTVNMDAPTPAATDQQVASERKPVVPIPPVKPQETVVPNTEQPKSGSKTPAKLPERTYVVGDGESLSAVAKKVYGPEEGNRIANVERIFQANRDILPSVDQVKAGQKLVIPPLVQQTVNPNKPSDVLPAELFERLEALKHPVAQTPAPSVESRLYTVQDGDNLWKIASSQLGAGARYEEIAKLNADLLKDKAVLDVGMKIRLPLK